MNSWIEYVRKKTYEKKVEVPFFKATVWKLFRVAPGVPKAEDPLRYAARALKCAGEHADTIFTRSTFKS